MKISGKFRVQYAEFIREFFEMGIHVTHDIYAPDHMEMEKILASVEFKDGDFSELSEEDLW